MIFVLGGSKCGFSSALPHYRADLPEEQDSECEGLGGDRPGLVHCFLPECLYTLDLGFIEL